MREVTSNSLKPRPRSSAARRLAWLASIALFQTALSLAASSGVREAPRCIRWPPSLSGATLAARKSDLFLVDSKAPRRLLLAACWLLPPRAATSICSRLISGVTLCVLTPMSEGLKLGPRSSPPTVTKSPLPFVWVGISFLGPRMLLRLAEGCLSILTGKTFMPSRCAAASLWFPSSRARVPVSGSY